MSMSIFELDRRAWAFKSHRAQSHRLRAGTLERLHRELRVECLRVALQDEDLSWDDVKHLVAVIENAGTDGAL